MTRSFLRCEVHTWKFPWLSVATAAGAIMSIPHAWSHLRSASTHVWKHCSIIRMLPNSYICYLTRGKVCSHNDEALMWLVIRRKCKRWHGKLLVELCQGPVLFPQIHSAIWFKHARIAVASGSNSQTHIQSPDSKSRSHSHLLLILAVLVIKSLYEEGNVVRACSLPNPKFRYVLYGGTGWGSRKM